MVEVTGPRAPKTMVRADNTMRLGGGALTEGTAHN